MKSHNFVTRLNTGDRVFYRHKGEVTESIVQAVIAHVDNQNVSVVYLTELHPVARLSENDAFPTLESMTAFEQTGQYAENEAEVADLDPSMKNVGIAFCTISQYDIDNLPFIDFEGFGVTAGSPVLDLLVAINNAGGAVASKSPAENGLTSESALLGELDAAIISPNQDVVDAAMQYAAKSEENGPGNQDVADASDGSAPGTAPLSAITDISEASTNTTSAEAADTSNSPEPAAKQRKRQQKPIN